ncbi:MAG: cob(I)yrinic acid a,c-diamide adenosyltransferase [Chitinispirillaceae bacterium]|nr:cob(I)yrinic acid a,c-diamide adenosyltransferase [Chitinispirillaceae bacterium]
MERGFLHIYTGDGKGKTTAALGLALRAAGAGKRVLFSQFLKNSICSEHRALERFEDRITVRCFGTGEFIREDIKAEQIQRTKEGVEEVSRLMASDNFGLVILDEIVVALSLGVIAFDQVLLLIRKRPPGCEMVLTGRGASRQLIDVADLVTEMVEVKHYFRRGFTAREGIER